MSEPCKHCGRCPSCGQAYPYAVPYYGWPYPYNQPYPSLPTFVPYQPTFTWGSTSGGATSTQFQGGGKPVC